MPWGRKGWVGPPNIVLPLTHPPPIQHSTSFTRRAINILSNTLPVFHFKVTTPLFKAHSLPHKFWSGSHANVTPPSLCCDSNATTARMHKGSHPIKCNTHLSPTKEIGICNRVIRQEPLEVIRSMELLRKRHLRRLTKRIDVRLR